jgi:hypothetical protein
MSPLQCQGQSVLWVQSGAAPVADPPANWLPVLMLLAWLSPSDVEGRVLAAAPEVPPPRSLSA